MKKSILLFLTVLLVNCQNSTEKKSIDFVLAFGSCNRQNVPNLLWNEVSKHKPNVWIWGGDVVYADTDDMQKLAYDYQMQWKQNGYRKFAESTHMMGTWDDHDYGLNDGGVEFHKKKESQQLFLDFINVPVDSPRRKREGVYHSELFETKNGRIKIIVLDTRYFRTSLAKSSDPSKRYQPNAYGEGTILGNTQWEWLQTELTSSKADFNIIMSSVQLLSYKHGYESWGNFPHEVDKLKNLIVRSKAKRVLVLSGDRHISEISSTTITGSENPLFDFTSSGLTHSYTNFSNEENPYRIGTVVSQRSFGLIKFDLSSKILTLQMRGVDNILQQEFIHAYN